jgi:hypothetical protein
MSVKGKKYHRGNKKPMVRKVIKKKGKRAAKVPKTINNNTMSTRMFWQMIRHILRKRTIYWLPIVAVRNAAKVPYKGPNKRRKFSYVCEGCHKEFAANQVNVHHIIPAGELNNAEDLPGFVTRLFVEREGLKLLCGGCHDLAHEEIDKQK